MGFEVSVVIALFFLSAVVLGTMSFNTLTSSSDIINDASAEQYQMHNSRLQTDISISNLVVSNVSSPYSLTVTLSNTGSETLLFNELNVLIDGTLMNYKYSGINEVWTPDEERDLVVSGLTGSGSHRLKVVTGNGVADYGSYSI